MVDTDLKRGVAIACSWVREAERAKPTHIRRVLFDGGGKPGFAIGPKREEVMRTDLRTKLTALFIGACAIALAACNTVEGAGQDIKQTGSSIENSANRAKQP